MFFVHTLMASVPLLFAAPVLSPVSPTDLVGKWQTDCLASSTVSQSFVIAFSAVGEETERSIVYTDNQCRSELFKSSSKSTYALHNDHLAADLSAIESYLEFDTPAGILAANTPPGTCHRTDWELSAPKSVIGTDCAPRQISLLKLGLRGTDKLHVTTCLPKQPCRELDYRRVPTQ